MYANGFHFREGRIAHYAILRALGIGAGDEVIIQAFTCVAEPCPILATGAKPVYADIDATLNLDPSSVEARLTPAPGRSWSSIPSVFPRTWTGFCGLRRLVGSM